MLITHSLISPTFLYILTQSLAIDIGVSRIEVVSNLLFHSKLLLKDVSFSILSMKQNSFQRCNGGIHTGLRGVKFAVNERLNSPAQTDFVDLNTRT